ncbi:hypothetical protein ARC272_15585 [Pantoea ananatis]|nr:hypothetical protein ARC272_15585 [Pantoea ananatis]
MPQQALAQRKVVRSRLGGQRVTPGMRAPMEGSRKRWDDMRKFAFTAMTGSGRKPATGREQYP